jgi:hypothetical protein
MPKIRYLDVAAGEIFGQDDDQGDLGEIGRLKRKGSE